MKQKNDKIPLWVNKYQMYVLISPIDDFFSFEIEYNPDDNVNVNENDLKKEVELIINKTLEETLKQYI
jgi:hypothetical protein